MKITKYLPIIFIVFIAGFLRMYGLAENPPSPYWEEVALGYDAYSILKTGSDHHGNKLPLVAFESFGDWKPSLYFYATALSESIFGLNTFAVRFPSAVSGIATVLVCYMLITVLLHTNKQNKTIALVASLLLAISPWHLLISRVGFETNLGFFLSVLGLYLFILYINTKKHKFAYCISSFLIWGLSLYAYHSNRIFIPLLIFGLLIWYRKSIRKNIKPVMIGLIIFALLILPIGLKISSPSIRQRFAETSALATIEPVLLSNEAISHDGNTRIAKIIHHRYWYYGKIVLTNYLSHFDWNFLFINGDDNRRHSIGLVGQLYWIYFPLLLLGITLALKYKEQGLIPVALFMLLAPVPAAFTTATPHALRSLPMVFGYVVLCSYGLVMLFDIIKTAKYIRYPIVAFVTFVLLFSLIQFWHYYWSGYRIANSAQWQYGYQELVEYIASVKGNYREIIITRDLGRPAMFYWFFTKTDPKIVQEWNNKSPKDQGEYLQFENLYFGIEPHTFGQNLHISALEEHLGMLRKVIYGLDGQPIFYEYER